jgi:hypothetical protein
VAQRTADLAEPHISVWAATEEPSADTLATVAAGRAAAVAALRTLADRIERLALPDAAEALTLLGPALDALQRQAALALERAPRL